MPSKVEAVIDSVRRTLSRWTITTTTLTAPAFAGDTNLTVDTTKRFKAGDVIVLKDSNEQTEPAPGLLTIESVPDETTIVLAEPLQTAWPLVDSPTIFKTVYGQYVRSIFYGEPAVIPTHLLPAITVSATNRNSDWYTTRMTKERYNIEIGVFVQDAADEEADRLRDNLVDLAQEGLKANIYPLLNDYELFSLTANFLEGDQFVKVADTSSFNCQGQRVLVEDRYNIFESRVDTVVDATTLKLTTTATEDFLVSNGSQVILPRRFIFNSWPADITYGKINKGSLLKAAVISWFAEEMETQFQPFSDTQLR